jgi:hypothetical protein
MTISPSTEEGFDPEEYELVVRVGPDTSDKYPGDYYWEAGEDGRLYIYSPLDGEGESLEPTDADAWAGYNVGRWLSVAYVKKEGH